MAVSKETKERMKLYYFRNKEARKEYAKKYYWEDVETTRLYYRLYRQANREKYLESCRGYYKAHAVELRAKAAVRREKARAERLRGDEGGGGL